MTYKYDTESNILSIKLSDKPFDYAQEMGDFIVHFDKKHKPVYIEILNANKFLKESITKLPVSFQKDIMHSVC